MHEPRRGGDIDLLIELLIELPGPMPADETIDRRTRFIVRLYRLPEERRIDVVMTRRCSGGQP